MKYLTMSKSRFRKVESLTINQGLTINKRQNSQIKITPITICFPQHKKATKLMTTKLTICHMSCAKMITVDP